MINKTVIFVVTLFVFNACSKKNEVSKTSNSEPQVLQTPSDVKDDKTNADIDNKDEAAEWLSDIFKCKDGQKHCFYIEKEKQLCTKRFYDFMTDSEEIFEASNLTEVERQIAEKKYKKKWSNIYELRTDETGAPWLFGRGNDDSESINDLKIEKLADLKYRVFVNYGDEMKTTSDVVLVLENGDYKIDYSKTKYLD